MSYAEVVAGLIERFLTVPGLSRLNNRGVQVGVLGYEPKTVQQTPTLYGILQSFRRQQSGQVTEMIYTMQWRLCVQWQDNEQAEALLLPFVNSIPAALDQDARLGGLISRGIAKVLSGQAGYASIAAVLHRTLDYQVEVLDKGPYKGGL